MNARTALWAVVIATILFLGVASLGRCKITPKTPDDTLCRADLNTEQCQKFQDLIKTFGHDMTVIGGTSFATVKQLQTKTFSVWLKCRDDKGNVFLVGVHFIKDNLAGIEIKPTGERMTGM